MAKMEIELTDEQLEKVENHAKNEGLTVEKDDNGDE